MQAPILVTLDSLREIIAEAARDGAAQAVATLRPHLEARADDGQPRDVLSTAQVADREGVQPCTVRRWIRDEGLPATPKLGTYWVRLDELDAWKTRQ